MSEPIIRFTREGVEVSGDVLLMALVLFAVGLIAALASELIYGEVRTPAVVEAVIGGLVGGLIGRWWRGRKDAPR